MKTRKGAILLSAFVYPGAGQVWLAKKRGWLIAAGITIALIWLMVSIYNIVIQEIPPEMMMYLSPIKFAEAFLRVRTRVYHENIPILLIFIAIWLGSIIDLAVCKIDTPEEPDVASE